MKLPEGKEWISRSLYSNIPANINMLDLANWALIQNQKAIDKGYDFAIINTFNNIEAVRVETDAEAATRLQKKIDTEIAYKKRVQASWDKQKVAAYASKNKVTRKVARQRMRKRINMIFKNPGYDCFFN